MSARAVRLAAAASGVGAATLAQRMRRRGLGVAEAVALGPARPYAVGRTPPRDLARRLAAHRAASGAAPCDYCTRPTTGRDAAGAAECPPGRGCGRARDSRYRRVAQVAAVCGVKARAVWALVARGATPEAAVERVLERAEARS